MCSWEAVTAGKHHGCGVTAGGAGGAAADSGQSDAAVTVAVAVATATATATGGGASESTAGQVPGPGRVRCWGSNEAGQSTPPEGDGVTLPWWGALQVHPGCRSS